MSAQHRVDIHIVPTVTLPGSLRIMAERARQMDVEGWTAEHDAVHTDGALLHAALSYIVHVANGSDATATPPVDWPWDVAWWKPTGDPVRDLTKAGALIAAELDRIQAAR